MEKFENLRKAVIEYGKERKKSESELIKISDASVNYYELHLASTDKRWNQFVNGEISEVQAKEYAIKRVEKKYDKYIEQELNKISDIAEREDNVTYIDIGIEHIKRRAKAKVQTNHCNMQGDVEYSYGAYNRAISIALNKCPDILSLLYQYKDKRLTETDCEPYDNETLISDGLTNYGILPEFALGGTSWRENLERILGLIGFKRTLAFSGENFELYHFEWWPECCSIIFSN